MKVIVQIPCFNEEQTLPGTIADIPRQLSGVDEVEILVIDDGSSDRTAEVARELGVDHIVRNRTNVGLARTFRRGLEKSLEAGADIIVNTDGDNQYCGADIEKLIRPILEGRADLVIGDRQTNVVPHFSASKKILQRAGSAVVRSISGVRVPDAVSGFRAMSRDAALDTNILSSFSYTIEAIIQAGMKGVAVESVPVRTNPKTRESRLFSSIPSFVYRQVTTIFRVYSMYEPLKVFILLGTVLCVAGAIPIARFLYTYFALGGAGHIQSLVLGSALFLIGFICFISGMVADLISFNRQLLELALERIRRLEERAQSDSDRAPS